MKTLDSFSWKGKRVLLRVDLNSAVINGRVQFAERFKQHLVTIKELKKKKAKVVILAHQSRPGKKDFTNLKQHAKLLNKYVKTKFVSDVIGKKAVKAIRNLKDSEVLLLDNVRSLKEEFKPSKSNKLVKTLAPLFDIYVNDAFSNSHRAHTSMVSFPKLLPSCAGRVLEHEVKSLKQMKKLKKPFVFVLGGAKPEEVVQVLKTLGKKADSILVCGLISQIMLLELGYKFGRQEELIKKLGYKLDKSILKMNNLVLPTDFAIKINNKRKSLALNKFPVNKFAFDIGDKTIKNFSSIIKKSNTVFMKGAAGKFEDKLFAKGTKSLLKAIEQSKAFSVVGGGHTTTAVDLFNIKKSKISHISLSGGALLDFLSGKKLPGLEALK